ncbi:MAG: matrixin family metalloprotease [Deltaproteobacteria bacterium]|nr:matrixin family metalloprotease [Deltaproteobacteria bacterium]
MTRRLLGVLVLLVAADAAAYSTITSPPSRWQRSSIPVAWYLNQNGSADLGVDTTETAVRASFDTWQNVDCCYIAFDYRGRSSMTASGSSGSNVVSWSESGWRHDSSAIAVCSDWFGSGTIVEADIDCNGVNHTWNTTGSGGVDTQSILTHEIGHFLGLGDLYSSAYSSSTMYGIYSGGTEKRTLADDDMAGCRYLYEEPCGTTGCTSDTDCPTGYHCEAPDCVRNTGTGGMCDPCSSAEDCSNGLCLSGFVDGGTYCGVNCTSDAECGAGNSCFPVSGGASQCAPTDGDCSGSSSGCTTDAECPTGYHCSGGTCVPDVVVECNIDTDCDPGERCEEHVCVPAPPTARAFGEPCGTDEECISGLCIDGFCSMICNPFESDPRTVCGAGYYCDNEGCGPGVCRRGGPGASPNDAACTADIECASGFCETLLGGICLTPCDPSSFHTGCLTLVESCQPLQSSGCGVCLCGAGMFGDTCASDFDCVVGLCRTTDPSLPKRCTSDCADGRCPAGATCQSIAGPDGMPEQRCIAPGKFLGGGCTTNEDCQSGWCAVYNEASFCTRPCGGLCSCPGGQTCQAVPGAGPICIPNEVLDDGCGCRAAGASRAPAWLALALPALLLGLRRRRRRG